MTVEDHLNDLARHIRLVQDACLRVALKLAAAGETYPAVRLAGRGFCHDVSKFHGIEWDYLHNGRDVPADELRLAVRHHQLTQDHHPEAHGSINAMAEAEVAEMVCDWYARSTEFGTGLRDWVTRTAVPKYNPDERTRKLIDKYLDLVLEPAFAPVGG